MLRTADKTLYVMQPRETHYFSAGIDFGRKSEYPLVMTTKQKAVKAVQALPDDASFEDALERILLLAKIERGIQQLDTGQSISHEKMKAKMKKWLK